MGVDVQHLDTGLFGPKDALILARGFGLGPPVERLEEGYQLFSVVYFSRGTESPPKKGKRAV